MPASDETVSSEFPEEEISLPPSKSSEELGILVLDGSGSMSLPEGGTGKSKAQIVEEQLFGSQDSLLQRLVESARSDELSLAVVTFDHKVIKLLDPTPINDLQNNPPVLNLLDTHGGSTAIGPALKTASGIAAQFLADVKGVPRSVTILLMSDGGDTENTDPVEVAKLIKEAASHIKGLQSLPRPEVTIAVAAYGDDADEATLRKIATEVPDFPDKFYKKVQSGKDMRDFFLGSIIAQD